MLVSRSLTTVAIAAVLLAACGGSDDAETTTAEATATAAETTDDMTEMSEEMADDAMDGMSEEAMDDMSDMDMGDADGTPAYEVDGADLAQGELMLLDGAPEGFADAVGTASLARGEVTTATIEVTGLAAGTSYVSHVHAESCATAGGPHYKFDPDGGDTAPNEIHLGFTTDTEGTGVVTVTNDMVAGDDAVAIVIHQADGDMAKALCADLT